MKCQKGKPLNTSTDEQWKLQSPMHLHKYFPQIVTGFQATFHVYATF